jgi:nucleoside-diphosphate-sugar epimerase
LGMSKRIFLVTGGAGFVGANLCRRLLAMGEEVHTFVRRTTDMWRLSDVADRLHIHYVDLCDDKAVAEAVDAIRPTIIYHLATHGAYHYQTHGDTILLTNVFGFWGLIHACEKHGYELFVNTGSSSEYGRKQFAMREADILEPDSYYAVAKAAQSLLARHCSQMSDLPIVTLRLFSAYGPYEEPSRLIPNVMMSAIRHESISMVDPQTARDFVYIDDVVDVYLDIEHLRKLRGEIINVGTGIQSSMADIVAAVETAVGHGLKVRWGEMPPRTWDSDVWVADVSKVNRLLASRPRTTIKEGLARCVPWFAGHESFYRPESVD